MNIMDRRNTGFTIVELLIVIVVIGILAALVLNSFAGAQAKARNASRLSAVKASMNLVQAYAAQEGRYPATNQVSCMGEDFPGGLCWGIDSSTPAGTSTAFLNELKKVGPVSNTGDKTPVKTVNWNALGPVYWHWPSRTVDGIVTPLVIIYFLEGNQQNCSVGHIIRENSPGVFVSYNGSPKNTATDQISTTCYAAMPNL